MVGLPLWCLKGSPMKEWCELIGTFWSCAYVRFSVNTQLLGGKETPCPQWLNLEKEKKNKIKTSVIQLVFSDCNVLRRELCAYGRWWNVSQKYRKTGNSMLASGKPMDHISSCSDYQKHHSSSYDQFQNWPLEAHLERVAQGNYDPLKKRGKQQRNGREKWREERSEQLWLLLPSRKWWSPHRAQGCFEVNMRPVVSPKTQLVPQRQGGMQWP